MSITLEQVVREAGYASEELAAARERARRKGIACVRKMETALVAALAGEKLKGFREVANGYYAARVRARHDRGCSPLDERWEPLPEPCQDDTCGREGCGREVLALATSGRLVMIKQYVDFNVRRFSVKTRFAQDCDLLAEDAGHFSALLAVVLPGHVERARVTTGKFDAMSELADRLADAVAKP